MKQTKVIMGMPITIEIVDKNVSLKNILEIFDYFKYVDKTFSTYKKNSEISKISRGEVIKKNYSKDVLEVFDLSEKTKKETNGYFDIWHNGNLDPSGLVKGWAIWNASKLVHSKGFKNFYINAGGDIQAEGLNGKNMKWRVGIQNPFSPTEIVKTVYLSNQGIATSGNYVRGQHIYNPRGIEQQEIVSITVISSNIFNADRFATAAFAMGKNGIGFVRKLKLEGYMIDNKGIATFTPGFEEFLS